MTNEQEFARDAAERWAAGHVYIDPEQAFYERYGCEPDATELAACFERHGVPYRDYERDGLEWAREVEAGR